MYKKISVILMMMMVILSFAACDNQDDKKTDNKKSDDSKTVAAQIGDYKIYLDEAKYYLYTSQASYETYYLTQDTAIDWSSKMSEDSTWEEFVKGATLDDICRRECMYSLKEQYNISLTGEEQQEIDKMTEGYIQNTAEILKEKIGISEKRLKEIFEKKAIAEKVMDILEAMNAEQNVTDGDENETGEKTNKKADEIYKEWKSGHQVTVEKCFRDIHFDEPIFTKESLTANPIITEEITTVGQLNKE